MTDYADHLRPDRGVFPLSELIRRSADDFGPHPAMRVWTGAGYREYSYAELSRLVQSVAVWLVRRGIKSGDRVAVLGENRPEWGMAYLAIQCAGAVAVPVDSLMPASGIRHILADSAARLLFVSGKFLPLITREMEPVETLETTVCFDKTDDRSSVDFGEIIQTTDRRSIELPRRELSELAAILYTSGTTGFSKGVMLTQGNIMSNVAAASRIFPLGTSDTFLSVLPIHHSFECTAGFLLPLYCGCSITFARSMKSADLIDDIRNTRVTLMVGVPLLFEKMHAGILRGIKKKGTAKAALFKMLCSIVAAGEKGGMNLGINLFAGLREKAGFGSVKFFVSGGGPLDPATAIFFNRLGIKLLQGYGLTETSPVTHVNPPWRVRHETVGPPIPGVECKIVDDAAGGVGEVCIRGPNVFAGYYNNPEATSEVLDSDGWFRTGDLGKIHPDGYLQIMGRKKNMIVTGGGKNVYPEEVEHHLNRSRFIAESLVIGTPRQSGYGEEVTALIYPDYEQMDIFFAERGKKPTPQDIYELIRTEVKAMQKPLAGYKWVRSFRIVDEEFKKTSTRKIQRFHYFSRQQRIDGEV